MDDAAPTILDRIFAAGISEDRARAYLEGGRIRVEGETVTDPTHPAPHGDRWVVLQQ